jgi:general nucleoside transport system ATP-binding protein
MEAEGAPAGRTLRPHLLVADLDVSFGAVRALDGAGVELDAGRVHAIVGQNGAGKTTLARVVAGMVTPDRGSVEIDREPLVLGSVPDAVRAGVAMVHQHFTLPPSFTVAEALELSRPARRVLRPYARRNLEARWSTYLASLGVEVDVGARVSSLPIERRQWLEIARCLASDATLLLLDEPTALLSPSGCSTLFERVRELAARGVTVVIVLHKLGEVRAVADTVTVMRDGRVVLAAEPLAGIDDDRIRAAMLGDVDVRVPTRSATLLRHDDAPRLEVTGLHAEALGLEPPLVDLTLAVAPGEIVGVAGVEGNGQRALAHVIAGLHRAALGTLRIGGEDVTGRSPGERRRCGLRVIPFDRNAEALSLTSALWENHALARVADARWSGLVAPRGLRARADAALRDWAVRYDDVTQAAGELSGGNAQRLVLAGELDDEVTLAVVAHPTRGLDFSATSAVRSVLLDLRGRGVGVLLISSDLDELFELSDRLLVLRGGRLAGQFTAPYTRARIGQSMVGGL